MKASSRVGSGPTSVNSSGFEPGGGRTEEGARPRVRRGVAAGMDRGGFSPFRVSAAIDRGRSHPYGPPEFERGRPRSLHMFLADDEGAPGRLPVEGIGITASRGLGHDQPLGTRR